MFKIPTVCYQNAAGYFIDFPASCQVMFKIWNVALQLLSHQVTQMVGFHTTAVDPL